MISCRTFERVECKKQWISLEIKKRQSLIHHVLYQYYQYYQWSMHHIHTVQHLWVIVFFFHWFPAHNMQSPNQPADGGWAIDWSSTPGRHGVKQFKNKNSKFTWVGTISWKYLVSPSGQQKDQTVKKTKDETPLDRACCCTLLFMLCVCLLATHPTWPTTSVSLFYIICICSNGSLTSHRTPPPYPPSALHINAWGRRVYNL